MSKGSDNSKNALIVSDEKANSNENPFESERFKFSHENPGFEGTFEFDLTLELFGKRVVRKSRVEYTFTPEWEYFDLKKNALYVGWVNSCVGLSVLTVP